MYQAFDRRQPEGTVTFALMCSFLVTDLKVEAEIEIEVSCFTETIFRFAET
jgi:hypothetical protein